MAASVDLPQQAKKRPADMAFNDKDKMVSPFLPMFDAFRIELDVHYDRRERVVKASRDITAASKKIIFGLQRIRVVGQPIPENIQKINRQYYDTISKHYKDIGQDLRGLNADRYGRSITGGSQEFIEAISFEHYLATQSLITFDQAVEKISKLGGSETLIPVTEMDYILGIYDMTGELMKFAITAMAMTGEVPTTARAVDDMDVGPRRNVLNDLRELRSLLQSLDVDFMFAREASKKMEVMQASVQKVEMALYGLIVRGAERPKGWLPDERGPMESEGIPA